MGDASSVDELSKIVLDPEETRLSGVLGRVSELSEDSKLTLLLCLDS